MLARKEPQEEPDLVSGRCRRLDRPPLTSEGHRQINCSPWQEGGPRARAPAPSRPLKPPPDRPKLKEQRGPRQSRASGRRATVSGRETAAGEPGRPGRGWTLTAPGTRGLPRVPCSGLPRLASDSAGAAATAASRTQPGGPEPWGQRKSQLPNVPGAPVAPGLGLGDRPGLAVAFVVYFRLSEPGEITTEMLGAATKCFH